MSNAAKHFFHFGPFRMDPGERILSRDGTVIPLTAKVFDTLLVLVHNAGQTVEKQELLQKVWPDTFIEEGNLAQNISVVRKALGDTTSDTRFIETVPRRGYRFIAEVRESKGEPARPNRRRWFAAAMLLTVLTASSALFWFRGRSEQQGGGRIRSLAVLPLRPLQTGSQEDQLGLGIADGVITRVSQISTLTVRPTGAIQKYVRRADDPLATARELGVDAVVDGTFQRSGDRLRASINLLRTRDGVSLWAETFDVPATGFFEVQDQVSRQIVARLRLSLTASERDRLGRRQTSNAEAYEYYLKGMNAFGDIRFGSRQALESAVALLEKAVEIDPGYALARAQLANAYVRMGIVVDLDNPVWIERAEEQLRRAQALDPLLAEVHIVRNWILSSGYGPFKMEEAVRELRIATQLNPSVGHSELGIQYAHLGLEELTIRELERAVVIDPIGVGRQGLSFEGYRLLGRPDDAITRHMKFWNRPGPVAALIDLKRLEQAEPLIVSDLARNPDGPYQIGGRALSLALQGKFSEAQALIPRAAKLRKNPSYHHATHDFAAMYAIQGNAHLAVKWLRETVETGLPSYLLFSREWKFDRIRKDPAFVQLMAELRTRWERNQREFH